MNIVLVHNEALPHAHKRVVLQLLEDFVEIVKLKGHLVGFAVKQIHVGIVSVCTDENDILWLHSNEFRGCRNLKPFHARISYYNNFAPQR
jgi:hypothetical protein